MSLAKASAFGWNLVGLGCLVFWLRGRVVCGEIRFIGGAKSWLSSSFHRGNLPRMTPGGGGIGGFEPLLC